MKGLDGKGVQVLWKLWKRKLSEYVPDRALHASHAEVANYDAGNNIIHETYVPKKDFSALNIGHTNLFKGTQNFDPTVDAIWYDHYQNTKLETASPTKKINNFGVQQLPAFTSVDQGNMLTAGKTYTLSAYVKTSSPTKIAGLHLAALTATPETVDIEEALTEHTSDRFLTGDFNITYLFENKSKDTTNPWNNFILEIFSATDVVTLRADNYGWVHGDWDIVSGFTMIDDVKHPLISGGMPATRYLTDVGVAVNVRREGNTFYITNRYFTGASEPIVQTSTFTMNDVKDTVVVHLTGEQVTLENVHFTSHKWYDRQIGVDKDSPKKDALTYITSVSGSEKKVVCTFTTHNTGRYSIVNIAPGVTLEMYGLKLEEGPFDTGWTPAEGEPVPWAVRATQDENGQNIFNTYANRQIVEDMSQALLNIKQGKANYEEGEWTPSVRDCTLHSSTDCIYKKIGKMVFIQAYMQVIESCSITIIDGLPYKVEISENATYGGTQPLPVKAYINGTEHNAIYYGTDTGVNRLVFQTSITTGSIILVHGYYFTTE